MTGTTVELVTEVTFSLETCTDDTPVATMGLSFTTLSIVDTRANTLASTFPVVEIKLDSDVPVTVGF